MTNGCHPESCRGRRIFGGATTEDPSASTRLRMTHLAIAFALWGLAIGIALAPLWQRPAPAGQLPGFATQQGFDAHAPFRFWAALVVVTLLFPLALRPIARRLASADAQSWARNATIAAALV